MLRDACVSHCQKETVVRFTAASPNRHALHNESVLEVVYSISAFPLCTVVADISQASTKTNQHSSCAKSE